MRWALVVGVVVLSATCATQSAAPRTERATTTQADTAEAPTRDEELAGAFAPEVEPAPRSAKPKVQPPPPIEDPRAAFRTMLERGAASLGSKQAGKTVDELVALAATLGGEERNDAGALAFRYSQGRRDAAAAQRAALQWRVACGPEQLESCRKKALVALASVATMRGAPVKQVKVLAGELGKLDACVAQLDGAARLPPCVRATEKTAIAQRDIVAQAHLAIAKASAEPKPAKRSAALERAQGLCTAPQCAGLRRKVFAVLVGLAGKDLEATTRLRLREVKVIADALPAAERPWARTKEVDAACAQFDAARGVGACRALERELNGGWTFRDFSTERGAEELSADKVKQVNEHYAPLLQECMSAQARRLTPPDQVEYALRWMVFNDGRVGDVHLARPEDDVSPLAECVRAQFSRWRYPRYEGEFQHVKQAFSVRAVERRGG